MDTHEIHDLIARSRASLDGMDAGAHLLPSDDTRELRAIVRSVLDALEDIIGPLSVVPSNSADLAVCASSVHDANEGERVVCPTCTAFFVATKTARVQMIAHPSCTPPLGILASDHAVLSDSEPSAPDPSASGPSDQPVPSDSSPEADVPSDSSDSPSQ